MKISNFDDCLTAAQILEGKVSVWGIAYYCVLENPSVDEVTKRNCEKECQEEIDRELSLCSTFVSKITLLRKLGPYRRQINLSEIFEAARTQCETELNLTSSQEERWALLEIVKGMLTSDETYAIYKRIFYSARTHAERIETIKKHPYGSCQEVELFEYAIFLCKNQQERWELRNLCHIGFSHKLGDVIRKKAEEQLAEASTMEQLWNVYQELRPESDVGSDEISGKVLRLILEKT